VNPERGSVLLEGPFSVPETRISYLGSVSSALRYLGVDCDVAEVAGRSGYAFLYVTDGLAESPVPALFDWTVLEDGTRSFGREVEVLSVEYDGEKVPGELAGELLDRIRTELASGHPCVVWGATGRPEFVLVYGARDRDLLVRSLHGVKEEENPVSMERFQPPGCVGGVFFGEQVGATERADRDSLARAVQLLRGRHGCFGSEEARGTMAFDALARNLARASAVPDRVAVLLAEWGELLGAGSEYLQRVARRLDGASQELRDAGEVLMLGSGFLDDLPGATEPGVIVEALRGCREKVTEAAGKLEDALALVR
jgi:hypothetical protein